MPLTFAFTLFSIGLLATPADAKDIVRDLALAPFTKIDASGNVRLDVGNSETHSALLKAAEDVIPHFHIHVENETLIIERKDRGFFNSCPRKCQLMLTIRTPKIVGINASGSIELVGSLSGKSLEIKSAGASALDLSVNLTALRIRSAGASSMKLSGKAKRFTAKNAGSSKLDALALKTEETNMKISGSGNATVYASSKLSAKVSGSGSIRYAGDPKVVDSKVSGSASVSKM